MLNLAQQTGLDIIMLFKLQLNWARYSWGAVKKKMRVFSSWNGRFGKAEGKQESLYGSEMSIHLGETEWRLFFVTFANLQRFFYLIFLPNIPPITPQHVQYTCVCGEHLTVRGSVPTASCHTKAAFRSHLPAHSTSHSHSSFLPLLQPSRSDACRLCLQ